MACWAAFLGSLALPTATKRVGPVAGEEGTSDCAGQYDRDGWTKRKLVDPEWLEMTLPIGSDEDADERT
jgi:hypothetical protein